MRDTSSQLTERGELLRLDQAVLGSAHVGCGDQQYSRMRLALENLRNYWILPLGAVSPERGRWVSVAVTTSKLASKRIGKTLTFTLVQDSSWESRAGAFTTSRGRSEYVNRSHPSTL
jgi:hypothetical protein